MCTHVGGLSGGVDGGGRVAGGQRDVLGDHLASGAPRSAQRQSALQGCCSDEVNAHLSMITATATATTATATARTTTTVQQPYNNSTTTTTVQQQYNGSPTTVQQQFNNSTTTVQPQLQHNNKTSKR
jgi:hypothetical protein